MKYLLFLVFEFIFQISWCQSYLTGANPCSKQLYIHSKLYNDYPYEYYGDFIVAYINQNFPTLDYTIVEQESDLIRLKHINQSSNQNLFKRTGFLRKNLKCTITIDQTSFTVDTAKINNDDYLFFEDAIADSLGHDYLGYVAEADIVNINFIKEIRCTIGKDRFIISSDYFKELINPNTNNIKGSLKPLEVYFDKHNNSILIYLYGNIPLDTYNQEDEITTHGDQSYFAKIIINQKGIHKITVPSAYLYSYGWLNCPYFWPM